MTELTKAAGVFVGAEVWVKTANPKQWQLIEGYYGDAPELCTNISVRDSDSGIFKIALEEQSPLLLTNVAEECAIRNVECPDDVRVFLVLPIFDKSEVSSLLICFLRLNEHTKGAVEIWSGKQDTHELSLIDGFYSGLQRFGKISRYIHMPYGSGLPGMAWQYGSAQMLTGIDHSKEFLRSSSAASEGLHTGIAIPAINYHTITGIVTFLSSASSPIGQVYELWKPDVVNGLPALVKTRAHYGEHNEMAKVSKRLTMQPGEGIAGKVWAARRPVIMNDLDNDDFIRSKAAKKDGLKAALAIPTMLGDVVHSICVMMW